MKYCVDNPEEINKLAKVKAQVSEVKGVMMQNIEKVRNFFFGFVIKEIITRQIYKLEIVGVEHIEL